MTTQAYNQFKVKLLSGQFTLPTATLMVMLVSGTYTFSHSHSVTGNITSEISSTNYTRGGKRITNTTITLDSVDNEAVLSGDNVTFSTLTANPSYAIVYISGATPATSHLIAQVDLGTQILTASDFTINWNSEGIYNLM